MCFELVLHFLRRVSGLSNIDPLSNNLVHTCYALRKQVSITELASDPSDPSPGHKDIPRSTSIESARLDSILNTEEMDMTSAVVDVSGVALPSSNPNECVVMVLPKVPYVWGGVLYGFTRDLGWELGYSCFP